MFWIHVNMCMQSSYISISADVCWDIEENHHRHRDLGACRRWISRPGRRQPSVSREVSRVGGVIGSFISHCNSTRFYWLVLVDLTSNSGKWNWPTSIHKFGSLGCWLVEAIQRCISLEHGQLAKLTWDSIYLLADRFTSIGILLATFHIICHSHDLNRFSAAHVSAQPVTVVLSLLPSHDADTTHPL